jgi:hypothetical protein
MMQDQLKLQNKIFIDVTCSMLSNENMTKLPIDTIISQAYIISEKMFDRIQENEKYFADYST